MQVAQSVLSGVFRLSEAVLLGAAPALSVRCQVISKFLPGIVATVGSNYPFFFYVDPPVV